MEEYRSVNFHSRCITTARRASFVSEAPECIFPVVAGPEYVLAQVSWFSVSQSAA